MDVHSLVLLTDQLSTAEIDARLYHIQNDKKWQGTTRNVVFGSDPLQDISVPLETLKVIPDDPPSKKIHVIGGVFYSRGEMYAVPGMISKDIIINSTATTYVYVGFKIDRNKGLVDLYTETTYGNMPAFHPDTFPCALVVIPPGFEKILSDFITDIRPWMNFDISHPNDRITVEIGCLSPGESQVFDRKPFHSGPPLMSVYTRVPKAGVHTVIHTFDGLDKVSVLSEDQPYYNDLAEGLTLIPITMRYPITIPATPNVLFVSMLRGKPGWPGTLDKPVPDLKTAVDILNGMTGYDTIFVEEGIYMVKEVLTIDKPVQIVGQSPLKSIIRMALDLPFGTLKMPAVFKTLQFQWSVRAVSASSIIHAEQEVSFFNCVFKTLSSTSTALFLLNDSHRVLQNCVIHAPYLNASPKPRFFDPRPTLSAWYEAIENNIILGEWNNPFPTPYNIIDDTLSNTAGLEDFIDYYLKPDSPSKDTGNISRVGIDMDGSPPDIGLYGGQSSSMARVTKYNVGSMPVFRYHIQTLFSPVISKFLAIDPILGYAPIACQVYGAVSFNGGHTWLAWDEGTAAWKVVDLSKLDIQGNTWKELSTRLIQMGDIKPKGEIAFAWGLKTSDPDNTPVIKGVRFTVQSDGKALKPVYPDKIDMLISEGTVMVSNIGAERLQDIVIVCY